MYAVLVILVLLIDASPPALILGERFSLGTVCAATAIGGVMVASTIRRSESIELWKFFRPLAFAAAIPACWMIVQILPVMNLQWAHPVWQSAAAALRSPILGSFSIDRGLTSLAFCSYTSAVAITLLAAAVAVDHRRGRWILVALIVATTLIAIVVAVDHIAAVKLFSDVNGGVSHDAAMDSVAIGTILSLAGAVGAFEKRDSRRLHSKHETSHGISKIASAGAAVICAGVIICFGTIYVQFALAFGLATFFAFMVTRWFGLTSWGIAGLASVMIVVGSSIILTQPQTYTSDLTLAFADGPKPLISVTERILLDGSWTGSGAGTFKALVPIYKDEDNSIVDDHAPTFAAAIAVELGRPALWAVTGIGVFGVLLLFRDGLARRRHSYYPGAGTSIVCTITLLAFNNMGLSTTPCLIIVATTLGMAFGQSKSRAASQLSEQSDLLIDLGQQSYRTPPVL